MDALTGILLMLLVIFILPGLVHLLVAAWDLWYNGHNYEDEVFDEGPYQVRPMSADRFDEYVVRHRPDLLFIDAVATQENDYTVKSPNRRASVISDRVEIDEENCAERRPLLSSFTAISYGSFSTTKLPSSTQNGKVLLRPQIE